MTADSHATATRLLRQQLAVYAGPCATHPRTLRTDCGCSLGQHANRAGPEGFTYEQVARAANLSPSYVYCLAKGSRKWGGSRTVALLRLLGAAWRSYVVETGTATLADVVGRQDPK